MKQTLMNRRETSRYLGLSSRTLEKWAVTGEGPHFIKMGSRTAYALDDINDWLAANRYTSTTACRLDN